MNLPIAASWFERHKIDDDITLLREPYVALVDRCNIWHVRGQERDILIDSGLGVSSLRKAAQDLFKNPVIAVATHSHYDHTGNFHEFDVRAAHRAEIPAFTQQALRSLRVEDIPADIRAYLDRVGYGLKDDYLISALPETNFCLDGWEQKAAAPTWLLNEGDVIDLGNRHFEILHLPGHSPGSIGLWEGGTGTLFSGDAIYDGPLLDEFPESNTEDYLNTMERLQLLPVKLVHGGHGPSLDRERLLEIAQNYVDTRG